MPIFNLITNSFSHITQSLFTKFDRVYLLNSFRNISQRKSSSIHSNDFIFKAFKNSLSLLNELRFKFTLPIPMRRNNNTTIFSFHKFSFCSSTISSISRILFLMRVLIISHKFIKFHIQKPLNNFTIHFIDNTTNLLCRWSMSSFLH